jgi:broad specificity phosphatase PhoE
VDCGYPHRDPPLTALGRSAASQITFSYRPDLVLVYPMTRTIETALIVLQSLGKEDPASVAIVVCTDLREAHDAECNKGMPRA